MIDCAGSQPVGAVSWAKVIDAGSQASPCARSDSRAREHRATRKRALPAALAAFELVRSVFQHPRCQNCHIPGDAPLQYDEGVPHAQLVKRGPQGHGATAMECQTCHGDANRPASYGDRAPPGAPNWHLPPPATPMVFIGLSPSELCRTIKDRKSTGGKDLAAMHRAHARRQARRVGLEPGRQAHGSACVAG